MKLRRRGEALLYAQIESAKPAGVEPRAYLGEAARRAIRSPGPDHRRRSGDGHCARRAVVAGGYRVAMIARPMAVVILGGLLSPTALNMVVLPALYWVMGGGPVPERSEL